MSTVRWVLRDLGTNETWTMPINPDSIQPIPVVQRSAIYAKGHPGGSRTRIYLGAQAAKDWGWGGVIRSEEHYNALATWANKDARVEVTDHRGKKFTVVITDFDPSDRKPTPRVTWRLRYQMKVILLEGPL